MIQETRFDLAKLDAEAADLHLVVVATQEDDVAVRRVAGQISGAVEATFAERVGEVAGLSEGLILDIATAEVVRANIQLACLTNACQLTGLVEDQQLHAFDARAHGQHAARLAFLARRHAVEGHGRGVSVVP